MSHIGPPSHFYPHILQTFLRSSGHLLSPHLIEIHLPLSHVALLSADAVGALFCARWDECFQRALSRDTELNLMLNHADWHGAGEGCGSGGPLVKLPLLFTCIWSWTSRALVVMGAWAHRGQSGGAGQQQSGLPSPSEPGLQSPAKGHIFGMSLEKQEASNSQSAGGLPFLLGPEDRSCN